ncbi:unnamed protein product [Echinostoma caproni]|uniref:Reverse transcriptase domain-containing protein n=1 Tax=Echinostoma caproni TaxID=27848 RepID=A0A183AGN6_9TREM|nr:unnamed protein product [Echinostoma caproni]
MYVDNIKIWRTIKDPNDQKSLQADLNNRGQWAYTWAIPVNTAKYAHLHFGRADSDVVYNFQGTTLRRTSCERDLGVIVTSSLNIRENTHRVCASTWSILGHIRVFFSQFTMDAFRPLYSSNVRPRLEYGGAATYPCMADELAKLECVQRAATRLIVGLRGTRYEGRLEATGLLPVAYWRLRRNPLCLTKNLRGDIGPELRQYFHLRTEDRTRWHPFTLRELQSVGILLVNQLSWMSTTLWNSLPATAMDKTDAAFKRRAICRLT